MAGIKILYFKWKMLRKIYMSFLTITKNYKNNYYNLIPIEMRCPKNMKELRKN